MTRLGREERVRTRRSRWSRGPVRELATLNFFLHGFSSSSANNPFVKNNKLKLTESRGHGVAWRSPGSQAFVISTILSLSHTKMPGIDSLPTELLLAIFELVMSAPTIDSFDDYGYNDSILASCTCTWPDIFDPMNGPWVLGQVCHVFRSVVLSIPELWSKFYVRSPPHNHDSAVEVLRVWLSRSGDLPLQFQITATLEFCSHPSFPALLTSLVASSDRWKILALADVSMKFLDALASERRARLFPFPLLKALSVLLRDWDNDFDDLTDLNELTPALEVFGHAPNLDTLINFNGLNLSRFKLPWNQLTAYVGSDASHAFEHLEVMLLSPNLVECDIAFDRTHTWPLVPPLVLRRLRKWTIRFTDLSTNICTILSKDIQVPNLQELVFLGADAYLLTPCLDLFQTILRSSDCSLQYLELSGCTDHISLSQFLQTVATITCLRIWLNNFAILPLTVLYFDPPQQTLVPMLNTLELGLTERANIFNLDMAVLAAVVRSRDCVRRLNIVMGSLEPEITGPQVFPPIMEVLQEEGLQIHVYNR
ncbi:hypothetical protein BT96DRAFT_1011337 [Gymnopus androsaceus JB14]|uniref:Uncharacterized protein n=1 Tax=Gymnopus androsaceus JB14 TaxID=1447944 RepID=A0A6A4IW20_9AGAR|nr:hypothetical protein BT96DRAFT_1011337 [Gymnopus androsaceus JB14]